MYEQLLNDNSFVVQVCPEFSSDFVSKDCYSMVQCLSNKYNFGWFIQLLHEITIIVFISGSGSLESRLANHVIISKWMESIQVWKDFD